MAKAKRMRFDAWMVAADRYVWDRGSVSVYDLPDCDYATWHDQGMSPRTAARRAIRAAKNDGGC